MASSSKRRGSSGNQSIASKTRVISVGRNDALPRKGNVSAGPRKPIVRSPVDAAKEPLPKALARSNKKPHKLPQNETSSSRTRTAGTRGRSSAKLKKPAAMDAMAETVGAVKAATTPDEVSAMPALDVPESEARLTVATEVEVEAPAIVEQTTIVESPFAPAPRAGKRALVTAISRLVSTLCGWAGVRR